MLNQIHNIDCLEGIKKLDDNSINLVVTSPPYNLSNVSTHNFIRYSTYQDDKEYNEYIGWLGEIFLSLISKLTDDGRVCINIGDQKNGAIPTHFYIMDFMFKLCYGYFTTIIWNKSQTARRTAWGSFMSPSCPSFPTPWEYILVFYKSSRKLIHKGEKDIEKQNFIDWSLALWSFPGETQMKKFSSCPAVFPEELPRRCIQMFTYPGDVVLDPFSGSGTTCKVAKDLGRQYIGFEIDEIYYKESLERLNGSANPNNDTNI
jgi:site-specific DNA-methyltransferase (adenine-specific)